MVNLANSQEMKRRPTTSVFLLMSLYFGLFWCEKELYLMKISASVWMCSAVGLAWKNLFSSESVHTKYNTHYWHQAISVVPGSPMLLSTWKPAMVFTSCRGRHFLELSQYRFRFLSRQAETFFHYSWLGSGFSQTGHCHYLWLIRTTCENFVSKRKNESSCS